MEQLNMELKELTDITFTSEDGERAVEAYRGISFHPEEAGRRHLQAVREQIAAVLAEDAQTAKVNGHEAEYNSYALRARDWLLRLDGVVLSRRARVLSWAISGRGNFPVARNEKAQASERSAVEAYEQAVEKVSRRLRKIALGKQVIQVGDEEAGDRAKTELEAALTRHEAFKRYNELARTGKGEEVEFALSLSENLRKEIADYVRYAGGTTVPGYALTNSNARIKRLKAKAQAASRVQSLSVDDVVIEGATVTIDREENRLRIAHEARPSSEVIADLKAALGTFGGGRARRAMIGG